MNANRLIHEKSPYLLQHANNPVNWYPWQEEAFEAARSQDKPVFLSVGYATCHWCHVMEKETFEDQEAAKYLNDTFICIKVDREERPDIDTVYMTACQMLSGSGGWPLTIFMTPDKKPFFAATYLPRRSRFGRPGIIELCQQIRSLWTFQRQKVLDSAASVTETLNKAFRFSADNKSSNISEQDIRHMLDQAYDEIGQSFDTQHGGFGTAPKFPTPHKLLFLLRYYQLTEKSPALEMAKNTLTAMQRGGIRDHVGFGFHRYATDAKWLVPHFEKMLYDQALLTMAYLETFQITREQIFADTAEEILTYVLRDMTVESGGFCAAEDADSEGEEGKFYVWSVDEFRDVLGVESARMWEQIFHLSPDGNFLEETSKEKTGTNILHLTRPFFQWASEFGMTEKALVQQWETARQKLFQRRKQRIHPLKDDKILTDWNGLMIAALAMAGRVLNRVEYVQAAKKAVQFILTNMRDRQGRLLHRFREGEAGITAHADDYAFLILGLSELYRTTFDPAYLSDALMLQEQMLRDYQDDAGGGFLITPKNTRELPVLPKEIYDGAIPSANSVSLSNLLRLSKLTGNPAWESRAADIIQAFAQTVKTHPSAYTYFLTGLYAARSPGQEIVIVGEPDAPDTKAMLDVLNNVFAPNQTVLLKSESNGEQLADIAAFTKELKSIDGKATAYVCTDFSCSGPVTDAADMLRLILKRE